jgi:hypothetical protein
VFVTQAMIFGNDLYYGRPRHHTGRERHRARDACAGQHRYGHVARGRDVRRIRRIIDFEALNDEPHWRYGKGAPYEEPKPYVSPLPKAPHQDEPST